MSLPAVLAVLVGADLALNLALLGARLHAGRRSQPHLAQLGDGRPTPVAQLSQA